MSRLATVKRVLEYFGLPEQALHHGLQLAAAVLLGYGVAVLLGLPERFWVVITVLIVMRADSDSAMDAGWERVRGTVAGSLAGMLGVYLHHLGANAVVVSLAIISLLAFASAAVPMLRSAAVAALIILGAGDLAGHSVIHVALLRVLQIGIGIAVSMALVLATSQVSTRARLQAGCASLLGRLALQLQMHGRRSTRTEAQAEAGSAAVRSALFGLATLAASADRKFPWTPGKGATAPVWHERHHRRIATLTSRLVQDSVMLNRTLQLLSQCNEEQLAHQAAGTTSAALASAANTLAAKGQPCLHALGLLAKDCETRGSAGAAMLTAPLRLLLDDLLQLCASVGANHSACDSNPETAIAAH